MIVGSNIIHKTYYDILGIKEDASYEQIRTTYRSAILSSHPDKLLKESDTSTSEHESGNKFIEVQRAWEVLSNPKLRAIYDSELQTQRQDAGTSEDVSLKDLTVEDAGDSLEFSYRCRCGDYFAIDSSELEEMGYSLVRDRSTITFHTTFALPASVVLPCGSCSLKIRLLINSGVTLCDDGLL